MIVSSRVLTWICYLFITLNVWSGYVVRSFRTGLSIAALVESSESAPLFGLVGLTILVLLQIIYRLDELLDGQRKQEGGQHAS